MGKYVVNATVDEFRIGEVVEINPALFADLIEAKYLSPIDERGNRLVEPDGEVLVLHSTEYEQRMAAQAQADGWVEEPDTDIVTPTPLDTDDTDDE
jgi:hypothetical protein